MVGKAVAGIGMVGSPVEAFGGVKRGRERNDSVDADADEQIAIANSLAK